MKVRGIENVTLGDLIEQVRQGGRFVLFHWSIGLGVKSVCLPSPVRFVHPGERAGRGLLRTLATLITGWWSISGGPRATIKIVKENLRGGRDVTARMLRTIAQTGNSNDRSSEASAHAA
jgi:hypothetical protein